MTNASTQLRALEGEIEQRDTPMTDAVAEMLGRLAFQLNNGDLNLQDFADVAQVEIDKLGAIERDRDTLKRRLDEAMKELEVSRNTIAALQIRRQYGSSLDNLI